MTDIKEIDYDQIIVKASNIANSANEMQNAVKAAFQKIEAMRENWFGNSYDYFIDVVNQSTTKLNKIFEITVSDIPHEIAAKAKSYAAANQSTTSSSLTDQVSVILNELSRTNKGSKIRFQGSNVESAQKEINAKFKEAKSAADKASSIATSLEADWKSISGDNNIRELKDGFNKLKDILEGLSLALDAQISAQSNSIEAIEAVADTVVAAKEVAENTVDAVVDAANAAVNKIQESASQTWTNLTGKN